MTWTAYPTFTVGQVLTSTAMNNIAADLGWRYRKTTSKQVVNTVTETDLLNGEITVDANAIGASGVLRLTAWGDWIQNSGGATALPQFKVKLGATPTTVIDTSTPAASDTSFAGRKGWRAVFELMNLAATNSQLVSFHLDIGIVSVAGATNFIGAATGEGAYGYNSGASAGVAQLASANIYNTSAIDTTAAMALQFTVINPAASATLDTSLKGAFVEVLA